MTTTGIRTTATTTSEAISGAEGETSTTTTTSEAGTNQITGIRLWCRTTAILLTTTLPVSVVPPTCYQVEFCVAFVIICWKNYKPFLIITNDCLHICKFYASRFCLKQFYLNLKILTCHFWIENCFKCIKLENLAFKCKM